MLYSLGFYLLLTYLKPSIPNSIKQMNKKNLKLDEIITTTNKRNIKNIIIIELQWNEINKKKEILFDYGQLSPKPTSFQSFFCIFFRI